MENVNSKMIRLIDKAMKEEQKNHEFYQESIEKVASQRGKDLLQQLAVFEKKHFDKLNELKKSLETHGHYILYKGTQFIPFRGKFSSETTGKIESKRLDALAIVSSALAREEESVKRYQAIADQLTDENGRDMFLKLADEETMNQRILNDEYTQLNKHGGNWSWGD